MVTESWQDAYREHKEINVEDNLTIEDCDNLAKRIHWSADIGVGTPVRIALDAFYRFLDLFRSTPKEIQ